jgi:glycine hydroxymethyltransferase
VTVLAKQYNFIRYKMKNIETGEIDYDELRELALKHKPKIILAGFSAYPRELDYAKFAEIGNEVGAMLMADMAHIAGLIAGKVAKNPFDYGFHVITTTTHKTLRGPRAALIFSRKIPAGGMTFSITGREGNDSKSHAPRLISDLIDKAVFPGIQGGPHVNQIAGVAVALAEAATPAFKKYATQIIKNTKTLAAELKKLGWRLVSDGTDTHLILVDTWLNGAGVGGQAASEALEQAGIIVNKNAIPFDTRPPVDPSGIRIGLAAETTRGIKEPGVKKLAAKIDQILRKIKTKHD